MTEKINVVRKVSPILLMIILIAIILSLTALYIAFDSFINESEALDAYSFLAIGFGGLALSGLYAVSDKIKTFGCSP